MTADQLYHLAFPFGAIVWFYLGVLLLPGLWTWLGGGAVFIWLAVVMACVAIPREAGPGASRWGYAAAFIGWPVLAALLLAPVARRATRPVRVAYWRRVARRRHVREDREKAGAA